MPLSRTSRRSCSSAGPSRCVCVCVCARARVCVLYAAEAQQPQQAQQPQHSYNSRNSRGVSRALCIGSRALGPAAALLLQQPRNTPATAATASPLAAGAPRS